MLNLQKGTVLEVLTGKTIFLNFFQYFLIFEKRTNFIFYLYFSYLKSIFQRLSYPNSKK